MFTIPIICSIKNLQIYSHIIEEDNKQKFRNNFISFNEPFSVSYDLYFYNSFQGNINTEQNIIFFEIPNEYLSNDLNSEYTYFFATEVTSDSIQVPHLQSPRLLASPNETITLPGSVVVTDSIPRSNSLFYVETETILENNVRSISNTCKIICDSNNNPRLYRYDLKTNTYIKTDNSYTNNTIDILSLRPFILINGNLTNNSTLYSNKKIYCDQCWNNIEVSVLDIQSNGSVNVTTSSSSLYVGELNSDNYFTYLRINNNIDIQLENTSFDASMGVYSYDDSFSLNLYLTDVEDTEYEVLLTNSNLVFSFDKNDGSYKLLDSLPQPIPTNAAITVIKKTGNELDSYETIWTSNILIFAGSITSFSSFSAYRYKTINDLGSIIKVISSSSNTILLQLQVILTPNLGNIKIYSHPNAIFDDEDEETIELLNLNFSQLNISKATLFKRQIDHYDDSNQKSHLITSNDAIFFTFQSFAKNDVVNPIETRTTSCPIISSNLCAFNIETTGVGVGMETTGTTQQRKFEVASNYTSHFYGPVEIFPVGAIYLSVTPDNPGKYFYGNWIAWGQGQMPIGVDPDVTDTNLNNLKEPNKTGGSVYHTIIKEEVPAHFHRPVNYSTKTKTEKGVEYNSYFQTAISLSSKLTGRTKFAEGNDKYAICSTGKSALESGLSAVSRTDVFGGEDITGETRPMFIMPPYITCYMWRRES